MGVYIPNMDKPKGCWDCFNAECSHWGENGYDNSADCPLIEVVQCKDCKWFDAEYGIEECTNSQWEDYEGYMLKSVEPTDFCSYGELANADQDTQCVESVE